MSFHEVFCADLPAEQAAILAVSQRPLSEVTFGEMTQNPAWKTLPSWAIISPSDFVIGPSGERFMAERAGATITEVEASHAMMISQPQVIADVILTAVAAVSVIRDGSTFGLSKPVASRFCCSRLFSSKDGLRGVPPGKANP